MMKEDHYTAVTRSRIIRRLRVQDPVQKLPPLVPMTLHGARGVIPCPACTRWRLWGGPRPDVLGLDTTPLVGIGCARQSSVAIEGRFHDLCKGGNAMAWQLTGQIHEACSCKLLCPCWLGPEIEPDQGWCGGMILFDIQQGHSDGVDLSGCKAVFFGEWPGNFWAGQGTARLIIDEATTADQRRELEAILSGQKGDRWRRWPAP
jgi:Protein of unknown function (DUF1326)